MQGTCDALVGDDARLATHNSRERSHATREDYVQDVRPEHRPLLVRAERYAFAARRLLPDVDRDELADAVAVITRSSFLTGRKVYRALLGLAHTIPFDPTDAVDSATAALLAIERSQAAWLVLIEAKVVELARADGVLADLECLRVELDRAFSRVENVR